MTRSGPRHTHGMGLLQILLVLVVILLMTVLALKMFQRSAPPRVPGGGHPARAVMDNVVLHVQGLTSEGDALQVTEALRRVPGVTGASVDFSSGEARVGYDPRQTNPDQLIAAVERTGFRASR